MPIPDIQVDVRGLESLNQSLQDISNMYGPRQARSSLRIPMRDSFREVEDTIRRNTPVDTGNLSESVGLRAQVPTREDRRRNPGVVYTVKAGWMWTRPSLWSQALAVEYGTRQVAERRVLRDALDAHAQQVVSEFTVRLRKQLDRTARRLRNRQQRSLGSR